MINPFKIATDDRSITYLYSIFGSMNGVVYNPQNENATPVGVGITLLGTMFKTFNTTILALGALILVYTTVVGVIKTAHEGEFMGKSWNNIWIPLRIVFGIAALVPTQSGYSGIQLIMMWVMVQGIGAADTLWNTVLGYVDVVGSPYSQVTIPTVETQNVLTGVFQGLSCDATAKMNRPNPSGLERGNYYCQSGSDPFCDGQAFTTFIPGTGSYSMGPRESCGTLSYCNKASSCIDPNSIKCAACTAQHEALAQIINSVLGPIAANFAATDYSYRDFNAHSFSQSTSSNWEWIYNYCSAQANPIPQDQCCVPLVYDEASTSIKQYTEQYNSLNTCKATSNNFPSPNQDKYPQNANSEAVRKIYWPYSPTLGPQIGDSNFIQTSVNYYTGEISSAVSKIIQEKIEHSGEMKSGTLRDAAKTGWILAGSYYYSLSWRTGNNLKDSIPAISVSTGNIQARDNPLYNFRNNFAAAAVLLSASSGEAGTLAQGSENLAPMDAAFSAGINSAGSAFNSNIQNQSGKNAMVGLIATGQIFMITAQILFAVFLYVSIGLGFIGWLSVYVLGTGFDNPGKGALTLAYYMLIPAFFALLAFMISFGGLLAIYTPLVPFVIFSFGAIGWLISVIETMVAGPLVAMGILIPTAHGHDIMGKSEPALMLLLNNFLRPSLMIFGLMGAMLLSNQAIALINTGFNTASKATASYAGLVVAWVLILCFYVFLVIAVLNKCFALIYIIPENVMRWIGGAGERYGEAGAEEAQKGAFKGAAGRTGGAVSSGASAAKGVAEKRGKAMAKEREKQAELRGKDDEADLP